MLGGTGITVALLVAVLIGAPGCLRAMDRPETSVRAEGPASGQARVRMEQQRRRIERAAAHAQMPNTLYASTPDHAVSASHPFRPPSRPARGAFLSGAFLSVEPTPAPPPVSPGGEAIYHVPLLVSASDPSRQGMVRIVNRGGMAGEVVIDAFDDEGAAYGPLTLAIGAGESVHLSAADVEQGSTEKGLEGSTGSGVGDWRLELRSALSLEVLAYVRTEDGFLSAMHDVVPRGALGYRVGLFNAGSDEEQVSRLRLVNPGAGRAQVRIEGVDDSGASPGGAVRLEVPAWGARTVSARALERGDGVSGALGDGAGRWRLVVTADRPIEVMSLLASAGGHLSNLSTVPENAVSDESGALVAHHVPLLPAAARHLDEGLQGMVRIVNRGGMAGEVVIDAFDDEGAAYGPLTLAIGAGESVHLSAADVEQGSTEKGLEGSTGSGVGDWRLELRSALSLEVLAYVRTEDGFLSAMHDVVPRGALGYRVGLFNAGSDEEQVSRLRLVNPGAGRAQVRIEGVDDSGASPGGAVRLEVPAWGARTVSARALERGDGVSGALGDGAGRWRLVVTADRPIEVMSLLASAGGHLSNLSTVPGTETAAEVFRGYVSGPVVQSKCVLCHVEGGLAGFTRLRFVRAPTPGYEARNLGVFADFLAAVEDGASYLLNKVQGVGHGGGAQVASGSVEFAGMERFLGLLGTAPPPAPITPQTLFETVTMASVRKTLRRAALIFAGRIPTEEEHAAAQGGAAELRETIRGLMEGPQFKEFLTRGANDRLLTERDDGDVIGRHDGPFVDFLNEYYRRVVAAHDNGDNTGVVYVWNKHVQHGARRAPLELIAHVAENDLPYTEVLTADYIMANPWSAAAYGASTRFEDPDDVHEFKPSRFVTYFRKGDGYESEYDPELVATRVFDPGPLITNYPHAGVLNTTAFLQRYPTTATNRNRARSRWAYYHFLGLDIEKSASRTTDSEALADTNNPTLRNPACTVCHRILDPVAGAFQNYGDEGSYKQSWGGLDSLDEYYREASGEERAIRAKSWRERETLSWSVGLAEGVETLRVVFANDFYDEETGVDGMVYLDRIRVIDPRGLVLASHEFEVLGPPIGRWGYCGERRRNPVTRTEDHIVMWHGRLNCALFVEIDIPSDGIYSVEIVAWADRHEQYGEDGFAKLSVAANDYVYQYGDTWYRDMRSPGFAGALAPDSDNSVQWLAKQMAADDRFAESAVKFWWPALMGTEVQEPPEDERDADFEGLLLAANAQGAEVDRLASGFRRGFHGGPAHNLKDLLVEMVLSRWFRADVVEDLDPVRQVALRDAGARRLLTPEELARKTAALTGVQWGREINEGHHDSRWPSALSEEYRLLYGGIDSDGITERARDMNSVMASVAKTHATRMSCPIIMREFYLLPDSERRLFSGIDAEVTPVSEFSASFEIESRSRSEREMLLLNGALSAGSANVRLAYTNDYFEPETGRDRNVYLDRIVLRNAAGQVVASRELEGLVEPLEEQCNGPSRDAYALWCAGSVDVSMDIPAAGSYGIEIVASGTQAGDEQPRLVVTVESDAEGSAGANAIRSKLVELHEKLLGVQVTPYSPDVEAAYRLFADVWERKRGGEGANADFRARLCEWWNDIRFYDGILDGVVVEVENEDGWRWHTYDEDRIDAFMDGIDWSDHQYAAQTWMVVLAYLLMDYRYLYL